MINVENVLNACREEMETLKKRFHQDEKLVSEAFLSMVHKAIEKPKAEVMEMTEIAQKLVNKWRGDSRVAGIESALERVWQRAKRAL